MATNCWVVPSGIFEADGVMAIETNVVGVTVSVTGVDVIPPHVAVTLVLPAATDVANPLEPVALLIVATDVVAVTQVTCVVRSCVVPSESVPIAVSETFSPFTTEGWDGDTARETRTGALTVTCVEPVVAPTVARICVVPVATV